ncbi:hypothetical protein AJ80_01572 [Polytolypa hystricis UAMH7299]|uniref:FAS1 domain-containing protein n=1 Tax=Polytolypa hystricis (strain UAMH7299) TaxID=1447883 RepID=A0A2B7YYQ8_POLH7|nr:hypothetical protein AJ80_01572 [Polytolypa hystricis UAMH7299]
MGLCASTLRRSSSSSSPENPIRSKRRLLPRNPSIPKNLERNYPDRNYPQNPIIGPMSSDHGPSLLVSDILSKTRSINIFASLTRDIESISTLLNDGSKNTTVLAPLNSAIQALPRKPWEDPEDYEKFGEQSAYAGPQGRERAERNLRRFVEAHLVVGEEGAWVERREVETLGGGKVRWEKREGEKIFIMPGDIEVEQVASKVSNGEVWILKGIINYAQ